MRKQELVHVHGLLAVVRVEYERRTDHDVECGEYDRLGIQPTSIHQSKDAHREAVSALAVALAANMTRREHDAVASRTERPER
jgi:hypothetical protein